MAVVLGHCWREDGRGHLEQLVPVFHLRASSRQGQRRAGLRLLERIGVDRIYSCFRLVIGSFAVYKVVGLLSPACERRMGKRVAGEC